MKKDGIKSWEEVYILLRESYESNKDERDKLFNENFIYCKEDQKMGENCCCKKEKKEFCVVYTIEGGEERHIVVVAKDKEDALHQIQSAIQLFYTIFGFDVKFIANRVYQEC